jgi:hypothetical protein
VIVVAVVGGGIRPMQARWETSLARYDAEKHNVRHELATTPGPVDDARRTVRRTHDAGADGGTGSHSR